MGENEQGGMLRVVVVLGLIALIAAVVIGGVVYAKNNMQGRVTGTASLVDKAIKDNKPESDNNESSDGLNFDVPGAHDWESVDESDFYATGPFLIYDLADDNGHLKSVENGKDWLKYDISFDMKLKDDVGVVPGVTDITNGGVISLSIGVPFENDGGVASGSTTLSQFGDHAGSFLVSQLGDKPMVDKGSDFKSFVGPYFPSANAWYRWLNHGDIIHVSYSVDLNKLVHPGTNTLYKDAMTSYYDSGDFSEPFVNKYNSSVGVYINSIDQDPAITYQDENGNQSDVNHGVYNYVDITNFKVRAYKP